MLNSLRLVNFRNYDDCRVEFSPGLNCFTGRNGHGKTNLLEGVYYLSLLRSFRTSDVNELRQFNKDFFLLKGTSTAAAGIPEDRISVSYGAERKMTVNDAIVYRASDFINKFVCVTFIPQDLSLVQGSPSQRRRFLDISISQISPEYLHNLQNYSQALRSRNAMLKNLGKYIRTTITAYDSILAREAAAIESARRLFTENMNDTLANLSQELLGNDRTLALKYMVKNGQLMQENNDSQEEFEASFLKQLEKSYERDCRNGSTGIGPHRSDFNCLMDNLNMKNYSSQGECRIASLALRLALLHILKKKLGPENLTLLVDDVIGELDFQRRESFFNAITGAGQTFFACTELPRELINYDRLFKVNSGTVTCG